MKTILSASVKGGVGKTTVAVGLAQALQRLGHKVGILDLDYRAPNVPIVLNAEGLTIGRTRDDALVPVAIAGLHLFSMAYVWPKEKGVLVEDNEATNDVAELLQPGVIAWPNLDFLVLDTPPTSSGIVRVALEASNATGAIVVSHPSRVSRADTLRTLDLFSEKQVPVYALVSNQGRDDEERERYDLTDRDIFDLARQYGIPIFVAIPHTQNLVPYFDTLAEKVVVTEPVVLDPPKEPSPDSYNRLVEWAQKMKSVKPSASS